MADPAAAARGPLPLIESPNNADALELRGRFDAEVIGPSVAAKSAELSRALERYAAATGAVLKAMDACRPEVRVSGMYAPPRKPRYQTMAEVYKALHAEADGGGGASSAPVSYDESLAFSCVNLSYDYDDDDECCDLEELDRTAELLLAACVSYFQAR